MVIINIKLYFNKKNKTKQNKTKKKKNMKCLIDIMESKWQNFQT